MCWPVICDGRASGSGDAGEIRMMQITPIVATVHVVNGMNDYAEHKELHKMLE